jgi:catechol 2,3-dioxygenase-like lactoylglutathione lyase family enzyme
MATVSDEGAQLLSDSEPAPANPFIDDDDRTLPQVAHGARRAPPSPDDVSVPTPRLVNAAAEPGAVRLRALAHVALPVLKLERSVAFWQGLLGAVPVGPLGRGTRARVVQVGERQIHLVESPRRAHVVVDDTRGYPGDALTVVFGAPSLHELLARLRIGGVAVERHMLDLDTPRAALLTRDPDGHWLAFVEEPAITGNERPLHALRSLVVPVASVRAALEEFHRGFGLPLLPRGEDGRRPPGVSLGSDARLFFVRSRRGALRTVLTRVTSETTSGARRASVPGLHLGCSAFVDERRVRSMLRRAGVRGASEGDPLFVESRAAQLLVAVQRDFDFAHSERRTLRDVAHEPVSQGGVDE